MRIVARVSIFGYPPGTEFDLADGEAQRLIELNYAYKAGTSGPVPIPIIRASDMPADPTGETSATSVQGAIVEC